MDLLNEQRRRAAILKRTICLPEAGEDARVMRAAAILRDEGICAPLLLGPRERLEKAAEAEGTTLDGMRNIDMDAFDRLGEMADLYRRRRVKEGLSDTGARWLLRDPIYFGAMLVRIGVVDGMTGGSMFSSPHVIRAAIKCIGPCRGIRTISSTFQMTLPDGPLGPSRTVMFADAALVPTPDMSQLADIGESTAETYRQLVGGEPVVAYLSFSTKGSTDHPDARKMADAAAELRRRRPDLKTDGELQADAALLESVAERKCPGSEVAGKANVFIFPDLGAANICYKFVERLTGATAIGMIAQGLARPMNDLSRGCSAEDVIQLATITALQTQDAEPA